MIVYKNMDTIQVCEQYKKKRVAVLNFANNESPCAGIF